MLFPKNNPLFFSLGFTLLEVMIAMAIMTLTFTSILSVEQGSINASARAKQMNIVGMLTRNQMVETEFKIRGKAFEEMKKEETGIFAEPYTDYRWKTEIKEIKFPSLNFNSQNNQEAQITEMATKAISNYFSKSLRELSVTVFWKRGSGEQSYTLSTYWVNLNNELSF